MPNQYSEAHRDPKGAGDARPTAQQIIDDEGLVAKWHDKTILVTGCSSGIGIETVRALASTGASLFCTVRNIEKGKSALQDILSDKVQLIAMDQMSLDSVRKGAADFLTKSGGKLNILICNAAIMENPTRDLSADGYEAQFATNHLAHSLLFQLVKDALLAASTPTFNSRVVMLSSSGHAYGQVNFGDYNWDKDYQSGKAYGQSKTACIYMSNYIDRHYGVQGLHSTSVDPGGIMTGLQIHITEETKKQWAANPAVLAIMKSPAQGASNTVYAAVSSAWEGKGGRYLQDCDEAPPMGQGYSFISGYAAYAYDENAEERLWSDSLKMVGKTHL